METRKTLSIVIPTYNSEGVLGDTLKALLPQVVNRVDIEVVVINNASKDKTQNVIDEYYQLFPKCFKCITREETIPAEENFKDGVHRASGLYILLLGDDDILFPNFINDIMKYLDGNNGLIYYNRLHGLNNLRDCRLYREPEIMPSKYYREFKDFIKVYTYEYNFMSSVIFQKAIWVKGEPYAGFDKPYYGYWWYASLTFGAIGYPCVYYSYPLVIQRVRDHSWNKYWPLYWIVGMFSIFNDLDAYIPGIYKRWYVLQHDNNKNFFISLFSGIANNKKLYKQHEKELGAIMNRREKILLKCVLNTPAPIGKVLQKLFRIIDL